MGGRRKGSEVARSWDSFCWIVLVRGAVRVYVESWKIMWSPDMPPERAEISHHRPFDG